MWLCRFTSRKKKQCLKRCNGGGLSPKICPFFAFLGLFSIEHTWTLVKP